MKENAPVKLIPETLEKSDPAIMQLLNERLAPYHSDPSSAITLEDFRSRLGRS